MPGRRAAGPPSRSRQKLSERRLAELGAGRVAEGSLLPKARRELLSEARKADKC